METALNPYSPGAGLQPPELVGRDAEIALFESLVVRARQHAPVGRGIVLHGLRGVGKTVLLQVMRRCAEAMGWAVMGLEARPGDAGASEVRTTLGRELLAAVRRSARRGAGGALRDALGSVVSFSASLGVAGVTVGIARSEGRADTGDLATDLGEMIEDLGPALRAEGRGLAFFIDELQDLDSEMLAALLAAQHRAGQLDLPFYLIGAGLPNLPAVLASARSYAERLFEYRKVGPLRFDEARDALVLPAERYGARFTAPAVSALVEVSEGYPYFLQVFGRAIWEVSPEKVFSPEDAAAAMEFGWHELDHGFFPARLQRATPREQEYLRAMAKDGDAGSETSGLAARLNRAAASLSPTRQSLMDKGIVYAPQRGSVAYTVPGMAAYLRRHDDEER